ncbi:MAG TPA: LuxR C-terminal-related transcriptional regulator [Anaerolineae bacterium]
MSEITPTPGSAMRAAPGGGLLATKLFARPARARVVARPRLTRLLDEGRSASLILVSAPAGFGKTTLITDWLGQRSQNACWLSLDAADNDPARFLSYLIGALQRCAPGVGEDLAGLLRSPEPPSAEDILAGLVNELAAVLADLILVLDDYHVITSPAVNAALTFLLENLPPNLHLVISSRADPPIPIARLRSRAQVVEVRTDELRFTPDEAAAFLGDTMGLRLSPKEVAALDERAEGWVAGLQMAALSMRGREDVDGFIQAFAGTNSFILDFLVEEVLSREPEEVQSFLLQTAILSRLSGPLCDAVAGRADGQQMLERLEKRNLFLVPLDDDRGWYRYHHLFADLLQARLRQAGPQQVARLLSRAADWCEENGQVAEAVSYALAARDGQRAARLVAHCWVSVANNGEVETAWSWLEALPEEVVRNSAALSIACCWVLWLKGQMGLIKPHLADAEAVLRRGAGPEEAGAGEYAAGLPIMVATLRSIVARYDDDPPASCRYAEQALALVPEDLPAQIDAQMRGLIFLALGAAYDGTGQLERAVAAYRETIRWNRLGKNPSGVAGMASRLMGVLRLLGRLREADEACREAMRFIEDQGMGRLPVVGLLHLMIAEILLERNELEAAERHLARGNELARRSGRFDAVRNAAPALARLRLARGDASGALAAIREAEAAREDPPSPLAMAGLFALEARVLVRQGALAEAVDCVEEARRLAGQDRGQVGEAVVLAGARVQAATARPDEAVTELTRLLDAAEADGRLGSALELRILRSLAYRRQGEAREAEADLRAALALAEPEGYLRIFADEGEPVADLLRKLAALPSRTGERDGHSAAYLATLLAAFDKAAGGPSPVRTGPTDSGRVGRGAPLGEAPALIEPLSERELEVLRLMAEGLTNEQIAGRLIIALGTAKAHVHNISAKLGAQNRAHAVARAKELGLL